MKIRILFFILLFSSVLILFQFIFLNSFGQVEKSEKEEETGLTKHCARITTVKGWEGVVGEETATPRLHFTILLFSKSIKIRRKTTKWDVIVSYFTRSFSKVFILFRGNKMGLVKGK